MAEEIVDHRARASLETHEKVCSERYGSLWTASNDLKAQLGEMKDMLRISEATMHARYTAVSNRLWLMLAAVTTASVGGLAAMVFHILTKGKS